MRVTSQVVVNEETNSMVFRIKLHSSIRPDFALQTDVDPKLGASLVRKAVEIAGGAMGEYMSENFPNDPVDPSKAAAAAVEAFEMMCERMDRVKDWK